MARYDEVYRSCGPLNQLGGIGAHSILVKAPLVEDRADVDVFFREMLGIDVVTGWKTWDVQLVAGAAQTTWTF